MFTANLYNKILFFIIGEHVETSAQSESDRTSQMENTSDEDKTPKRTRMPRKPLFKNMCFLLTQAKEKSEEQGMFTCINTYFKQQVYLFVL